MTTHVFPQPVIGLTLSGGGARGLAHIGVLKVFEREGIPIDCLSGASMGGVLAAAYAAGWSAGELEEEALRMASLRRLVKLVDLTLMRKGLLAGDHVRAYLAKFVDPALTFQDLRLPLALEAVDLRTGKEIPMQQGSVLTAMLATSAFPGVFPPVEINGQLLVDGGLLDNIPVDLARQLGAQVVIAIDVSSQAVPEQMPQGMAFLPGALRTSYRALAWMMLAVAQSRLERNRPDILLRPHVPADVDTFFSFSRAAEIIASGVEAAEQALPRLANAVQLHSQAA